MHFAAMVQKSRQGGRPVYWASASMFFPVGKRRPISHKFTVLAETPRSAAICFNRRLFRCRHALKLMAKLLRISHPTSDCPATEKFQHNGDVRESGKSNRGGLATWRLQISITVISGRQLKRKL